MNEIIAIVGPTAVGKTALSFKLDISVNDIVTFDLERGDRGLSAVNVCLENK